MTLLKEICPTTMRDLKKYFFESLIQLTVLAGLFRQNCRYDDTIDEFSHYNQNNPIFTEQNSNLTAIDLLLNNNNNNYLNIHSNLTRQKELEFYLRDIQLAKRLNKLSIPNQRLILLPASFLEGTNNQKEALELSETRILLNSIELNNNNPTLRKVNYFCFKNQFHSFFPS